MIEDAKAWLLRERARRLRLREQQEQADFMRSIYEEIVHERDTGDDDQL